MTKALRVAIIVQQGVFRSSLCAALEQYPDLDPFGVPTIPDRSFPVEPDMAIIDLDFQPDNHRELLRRLIAMQLKLSEKTIKNHVSHIFRKLKITARTQAAIHAISNNLLRAGDRPETPTQRP